MLDVPPTCLPPPNAMKITNEIAYITTEEIEEEILVRTHLEFHILASKTLANIIVSSLICVEDDSINNLYCTKLLIPTIVVSFNCFLMFT